jgi:hypothetical protein
VVWLVSLSIEKCKIYRTMKIEDAKRLYAIGGESKEIALEYFPELKERTLPKTWQEYEATLHEMFANVKAPREIAIALDNLVKIYLLKQEYNGDWVADWKDVHQNKWVIFLIRDEWKKEFYYTTNYFLAFKSPELRDQFAANFADLIEAAKPLLG